MSGLVSLFGKSRKLEVLSLLILIAGIGTAAVVLLHIVHKYRKREYEHENSDH